MKITLGRSDLRKVTARTLKFDNVKKGQHDFFYIHHSKIVKSKALLRLGLNRLNSLSSIQSEISKRFKTLHDDICKSKSKL